MLPPFVSTFNDFSYSSYCSWSCSGRSWPGSLQGIFCKEERIWLKDTFVNAACSWLDMSSSTFSWLFYATCCRVCYFYFTSYKITIFNFCLPRRNLAFFFFKLRYVSFLFVRGLMVVVKYTNNEISFQVQLITGNLEKMKALKIAIEILLPRAVWITNYFFPSCRLSDILKIMVIFSVIIVHSIYI